MASERGASERGAWGRPLPGPIRESPRGIGAEEARAMLATAVRGLELGEHDRRVLAWLDTWHEPTVCTLASIIARGRAPALQASVTALRAGLDGLLADVQAALTEPDAGGRATLERIASSLIAVRDAGRSSPAGSG